MKGRPEGTLQREAGDLFLSLLLCSEKGVLSSYQMKMGVWNRALWASDLNLHMELRPAHLCFPAERAKGAIVIAFGFNYIHSYSIHTQTYNQQSLLHCLASFSFPVYFFLFPDLLRYK